MYGQETSIDGPADSDDDDRFSPSDWLTRTSDQPEAILEAEDRQHLEGEGLQTALAALDPRSRRVIEARYLTVDADGTAKPVTLQALAHELGVSAERVRQIEKLAIKKMGEKLAGQRYHSDQQTHNEYTYILRIMRRLSFSRSPSCLTLYSFTLKFRPIPAMSSVFVPIRALRCTSSDRWDFHSKTNT